LTRFTKAWISLQGGSDSPSLLPQATPVTLSTSQQEHSASQKAEAKASKADSESQPTHPKLTGYLRGQLFSSTMFGLWWVLSSPMFIALFGKVTARAICLSVCLCVSCLLCHCLQDGVGWVRIAFNAALFVLSPIAGAVAGQFT
jgi:hypothetical protein